MLLKKYQFKKEVISHKNARKQIQILLKFHFETIETLIGFIVNQLQNFKNFGIIKINLKLTGQYGVQTYFFIRKFNEYTCMKLQHKDHHVFKGLIKIYIYIFLFGRIYVTHTWIKFYIIEVGFESYLHF